MTTSMMTLADFLLARIAEDEAVAQAATPGPWRDTPMGSEGSIVQAGGNDWRTARKPATCREFPDATHIARHDPARVLAECAAKRRLVERCRWADEDQGWVSDYDLYGEGATARDVLTGLASVYADHPDYREEWKP